MDNPSAPLMRHLTKTYSPAVGQDYQRLPLFLLPEDLSVLTDQEGELLASIGTGEERLRLPYDNLLLDFPSGAWAGYRAQYPELPDRGRLWVRVRLLKKAQDVRAVHPFVQASHLRRFTESEAPEGRALIAPWEEYIAAAGGGFHHMPDFSVVPLVAPYATDFGSSWHAYPDPRHLEGRLAGRWCHIAQCTLAETDPRKLACHASEIMQSMSARLILLAVAYLNAGVSLTVKVQPRNAAARKPQVVKDKPWLVSQPHYILIDPERLRELGHPAAGIHSAPFPHTRRGH